ncbi:MAG: SET domain-containing protein [bacterium]|nr:SET domain-containing protein [bacterium]
MKKLPHDNVWTRLMPSKISGVGVFAIRDISANTNLFEDDDVKMVTLQKPEIDAMDLETKKLYDDFCVIRGDKYICPQNFNDITVGWFINHSTNNPNVRCDKNLVFHSARDIKAGEELTLDYSTYSEK